MFTTLLKVSKAEAIRGIYHTRQNGDFVQELFRKDADLVYEVTEHNNNFGQKYAFFIIECEEHDILAYGQGYQVLSSSFSDYTMYLDAINLSEMCEELLNQGKPLPKKLKDLLAHQLPRIFSYIVQWESRGYDSASIWGHYAWILSHLGKSAADYVQQSDIDAFFMKLCRLHDVFLISRMLPSTVITVSPETADAIEKCKSEVQETVEIAKKLISNLSHEDVNRYCDGVPTISVYAEDTPCGRIGVHVHLDYDFIVVMAMDSNLGFTSCRLNITKDCQEFKDNFKI